MGSFSYGNYPNAVLANGYVSVPLITDKLALSVAGVYDKRDGTVTDPLTGRKYNDRNTQAGRAILRATPSDPVEPILSADYTRQRTAATLGYATAPLTNVDLGTGATTVVSPAYPYGPYHYQASTAPRAWPGPAARPLGRVADRQYRAERRFLADLDHRLSQPSPRLLHRF